MKRFILLSLSLIAVISLLASCGSGEFTYRNDVAVADLCEAADGIIGNTAELTAVPETYVTNIMKIDISAFSEFAVIKQVNGQTIDEYGIFKLADAQGVDAALLAVNDYIKTTLSTSMVADYMPEELPKLEGAEVRGIGEYVVYCILSDDVKTDVFDAIQAALIEK